MSGQFWLIVGIYRTQTDMTNGYISFHFLPARLLKLVLIIYALGSGAAVAQQMDEGNHAITSITLSSPEAEKDMLKTYFELPSTPLPDDTARDTFMRRAKLEIGELLATDGYFTPTVTPRPVSPEGVLVVEIMPGPRALVSGVNIDFIGDLVSNEHAHLTLIKRLRATWTLRIGDPFRATAWEEAKTALLSEVAKEDYAAAHISTSRAEVNPASARVQLTIVIDSGPAFRFGHIEVSGLERYQKELVTHMAPFHPGDPYRRDQLLTFQARLQNMPQFSSAIVNIEPDVFAHESAPIKVVLTETKSMRVAIGAGYSTNNGARSEINYLNHNFLGRVWNFTNSLTLEQNRQTLAAGIDLLPNDNDYRLSWAASGQATLIQGLRTLDKKLGVTRSRSMGQIETQTGITWQQENTQTSDGIQNSIKALVPDWQWHRRAVDDPLYPRQGNVTEVRIGGGSSEFLSDQNFLRSYARAQIWWPVGKRDAFTMRGEAGYTAATSRLGIPQEYLFRAGGSQSVRGYAYQSLGVLDGSTVVGGRVLSTGSIEYTHWFSHDWGAALFTDVGGAADVLHDLHMSIGYGSGVRWRTPVGPLALDLAWGHETHAFRMNFSFAVAL